MLSIIICTRDASELAAVSASVAATIGVPYEIIAIDNSQGRYGICEAYNLGAAQAKYEFVCFMHEDIRFHTTNWGQVVANLLADHTIGVLGVCGGLWQVAAPAPWWGCGLELCRENVVNVFADGRRVPCIRNPNNEEIADVAVVDGLWMCSRKDVWYQHPFDSMTFSEFHFYDVDYCTEVFIQGLRVCVTYGIILEHHSRGTMNKSWVWNALKYQRKRHGQLPFGTAKFSRNFLAKLELRALHEFTIRLIQGNFPNLLIARHIAKCLALSPFNRDSLWLTKQWLSAKAD